ncbi:hypothetical protein OSB04_019551 [Centaurea solstitialis]|uniref:Copia protein n=1 Tax=Centaurea solstitialis TaxID=347529 RepID=A0AA38SY77_9ASTR|nr:hypothetical protein OSB04_019551 [Centaurea solstitialis]
MPTLVFTPLATHFLLNKEMFHFITGTQHIIYQVFIWKIDIETEGSCPAFELHFYTLSREMGRLLGAKSDCIRDHKLVHEVKTKAKSKSKFKVKSLNLEQQYPKGSGYELTGYTDADHGGCKLDRKSTTGHIQFLGDKLVSWASKKQNCVSLSTAEAEYVAAASCCSQIIWMCTQLRDYGFKFDKIPIYCDSKSTIIISCNPVQHTKTKHVDCWSSIDAQ